MSQKSADLQHLRKIHKAYKIPFDIDHNAPDVPWSENWMHKADGIIASIEKHVKDAKITFDKPVKDLFKTPQQFQRYKDRIVDEFGQKIPMDFPTVRQKLREHKYVKPIEYHLDMQRIWANCCRYNGPEATGKVKSPHYEKLTKHRKHLSK